MMMVMMGFSFYAAYVCIDSILDVKLESFEEFSRWLEDDPDPDKGYSDPNVIRGNGIAVNISQILGFLGAAFVFVIFFGRTSVNSFWIRKPHMTILIVPLLGLCASPLIYLSQLLNEWLVPVGGWIEQNIKPMEDQAAKLTEAFMYMPDSCALWMNIVAVAVIPAICEEFLFRGVIQSQLGKAFKNIHVAIWFTAAFFSFIHFQFYGFLPRMLLGAFFGYLLIWTGSIWAPIVAHFTNNAMAVLGFYYTQHNPDIDVDALESSSVEPLPLIMMSAFFIGGITLLMRRSQWSLIKTEYEHSETIGDQALRNRQMN